MRVHVIAGAVGVLFSCAAVAGPNWVEPGGGAGSSLATADEPSGSGLLHTISGRLRGPADGQGASDFEDVYRIFISAPTAFSARTFGGPGSATFNTQLWLFDASGRGLLGNDDAGPGEPGSLLLSMSTDLTGVQITTPGVYYLAISGLGNVPVSAGGMIFEFVTPFEISGPDGPGGAAPLQGWSGAGAFGDYVIELQGVSFVPSVGSAGVMGVFMGMVGTCRRRRG